MIISWLNQPISKISLACISSAYMLLLNMLCNPFSINTLLLGIWPALVVLSLLAIIALTHRYFIKTLSITFITITGFCLFFKYNYNIIITEDIVLSAWLNDASLSQEMLSSSLLIWLLFTCILPCLYIINVPIKKIPFKQQVISSNIVYLCSAIFITLIFMVEGLHLRQKGQIRDPQIANSLSYFSPVDALYSARSAYRSHQQYQKQYANIALLSQRYHYTLLADMNDITVVIVVGETARGDHFSLNGYPRLTNPQLANIDNLYSFSQVDSCNTITIRSMKCIFSRVNTQTRTTPINESAFTEVMKSLGFTVDIFSLQGLTDVYRYLGYDQLVSKYAVLRASQLGAKDVALLPFIKTALTQKQNTLVVLHTLGSHQAYHDRTLKEHQHFTPFCTNADVKSCNHQELINAYDNSIIATDDFLAKTIHLLEHKKAVLLYVSDHGESLGENGYFYHGIPIDKAPKEQFHVPFIIWLSPSLISTDTGQQIKNHLDQLDKTAHFSHDNFFHSVLGCAGIQSKDGGIDNMLNLCATNTSPTTSLPMEQ